MSIITDGRFETGDLSVYEGGRIERVAADRIQVYHRNTGAPVREGNYACRFTVRQGDDPVNSSGNRAELNMRHVPNRCERGMVRWYKFSTYFPTINGWHPSMHPTNGSANNHRWCVFWQVHQYVDYGEVPVSFTCQHARMRVSVNHRADNDSRIYIYDISMDGQWDRWHDFIFHVRWDPDPNVGYVELWHQGIRVAPRTSAKTMVTGDQWGYIKYGYYRGVNVPDTASIIHDGLLIATSQSDVMGGSTVPPPPPPDPGPQPPPPDPPPGDPDPPPPPDPDPPPPTQPPPTEPPRPPPEPDTPVLGDGVRLSPATPRSKRRIWTGNGF